MDIKELQGNDIPKLKALLDDLTGMVSDISGMIHLLDEIKDKNYYKLFCLYEQGELIGTASLTKCFDLTNDCTYYYSMENFIIDKNYRRKGYGSFLLKALEEYVINSGGRYINFTSASKRTEAHNFYQKNGYDLSYAKGFKKEFR